MTKEQEAQQAQTIDEVKRLIRIAQARHNNFNKDIANDWGKAYEDRRDMLILFGQVLEIVDPQAQKIAELQARAPKQYTEAELREGFESWVKKNWRAELHKKALKREGAGYYSSTVNDHWTGWINGARYTNSLMEPHA